MEINHENTDEVVCPYCGQESSDSWELDDDGVTECYGCDKKFNYTKNISVDYSTSKIECKEGKHNYVFESPHLSYSKTEWKTDKVTVLPEREWRFIEIQKCELCDDKTYSKVIPQEEWITKYPDEWEMYGHWIEKDRIKESKQLEDKNSESGK